MAQFPALPLWTDAYLGDTRHLSQAEHGAYLLLLITAWRTAGCSLPDDDRLLSRYAGCKDPRTWRRQKPVVMAFWELRGGRWYQKRLTTERRYVAELARKRAEAGREGAEARWRKGDETLARCDGKIPDTVNGKIPERSPADRGPNALKTDETAMAKPSLRQWQTDGKLMAPIPTPNKEYTRSVKPTGVPDSASENFDAFWRVYPSRRGHANPKKPAREWFAAAVKRGVDPALIIRAAENYAAFAERKGVSGQHIAQTKTWLSQCRWEDYDGAEPEPESPVAGMI
jgi:uncharacterized protein YdaU (DUF1376 family)